MFRTALGRHKAEPFLNLEIKSLPLCGKKKWGVVPKNQDKTDELTQRTLGRDSKPLLG